MAQALAALELVPDRGRGSLGRIKEARLEPVWRRLHDEPTAQMLVLFAAEVLRRVLHEEITPQEGLKLLLSREQKPEYPQGLFE